MHPPRIVSAAFLTVLTSMTIVACGDPAEPPTPNTIELVAGDNQSAEVGTPVAVPPALRVLDQYDEAMQGVEVRFAVTEGSGSVNPAVVVTTASGIATVGSWTLGTTVGENALSAEVTGLPPVLFNATATPGPPAQLQRLEGDSQSAEVLTQVAIPPKVRVLDRYENAVPGVEVEFSVVAGDGTITGRTPVTDGTGMAAVESWTLGPVAGENTLKAGANGVTASFTAIGFYDLNGTYRGPYTATLSGGSTFTGSFQLAHQDEDITGTVTTSNGRSGTIEGSLSGSRITFTITFTDGCGGTADGAADVLEAGKRLVGNYQATDCLGQYSGTFDLQKEE